MSALPKYLLSLGIFLLGGIIQLSAHSSSSPNDLCESEQICSIQGEDALFVSTIPHKEQQKHTVSVLFESEGENELISFKKRLESSQYLVNICLNTVPRDYFNAPKIALPSHYVASYRYLLIQVFRI
jgi:hypothetical protein